MNKRFLMVIIGPSNGVDKDLNRIADGETGVNFVDGKGMFICTFYSPMTISEIHEKLNHRPAMMIFDITNVDDYAVNLPTKYFLGLFPEIKDQLDGMYNVQKNSMLENDGQESIEKDVEKKVNTQKSTKKQKIEEYTSINEILDKLSRNNYDRTCLTKKEIQILDNIQ